MEPLAGLLAACETATIPPLLEAPLPPAGPEGRAARVGRGTKRSRGDSPPAGLVSQRKKRLPPKRKAVPVAPAQRRGRPPRSPDEKRKLSRQMAAFMRYGVLHLPEHVKARDGLAFCRVLPRRRPRCSSAPRLTRRRCRGHEQLNKKQNKDDEEGLEYRAAFNLLLDLCFGESLKAWVHVSNWFFLHAGAQAAWGRVRSPQPPPAAAARCNPSGLCARGPGAPSAARRGTPTLQSRGARSVCAAWGLRGGPGAGELPRAHSRGTQPS